MKLPLQTRITIADNFGIVKKGSTEVFNNEVVKDGYLLSDVEGALNIDAIQNFLNTGETDFSLLWEKLIARIEGREIEEIAPIQVVEEIIVVASPEDEKETPKEEPTKKRGRPSGTKNKSRA